MTSEIACIFHGPLSRAKSVPNFLGCSEGCTWAFVHEGVVLVWVDTYGPAPLLAQPGGAMAREAA